MNNDNSKALYQCQNCGMTFGPESAQLSVEEIRREGQVAALSLILERVTSEIETAEECNSSAAVLALKAIRLTILTLLAKPAETKS